MTFTAGQPNTLIALYVVLVSTRLIGFYLTFNSPQGPCTDRELTYIVVAFFVYNNKMAGVVFGTEE
jgi:hypothetical protein